MWQLAGISGFVLFGMVAGTATPILADILPLNSPLDVWVAVPILYTLSVITAFAVARVIQSWAEKARFQECDRHLGTLFGIIKGSVASIAMTTVFIVVAKDPPMIVQDSMSHSAVVFLFDQLRNALPDEGANRLERWIDLKAANDDFN